MQHEPTKNKQAAQILLSLGAVLLLAGTGSAGMGVGGTVSPAHDDADTDCTNIGPALEPGDEAKEAMDPAADTQDAVGLLIGPAWQERAIELSLVAGPESAAGTYTLDFDVFASTGCTGTPVATDTLSYGETSTLPLTASGTTTHTVRVTVDNYAGSTTAEPTKSLTGHCFPNCLIDWSVRFTVPM